MKTLRTLLLSTILSLPVMAQESAPKLINYQGKLTTAGGQAMADGTYQLRFSLYSKKDSSQPGDTLVWGSEYSVAVVTGQFNVVLGAAGGNAVAGAAVINIEFAFGDSDRFLEMTVLSDSTGTLLVPPQMLSPRQQLLSSPYALESRRSGNGVPVGSVIAFGGVTAPPGYLLCDGTLVSRATYPELFATINTSYGSSTGSDFRLPNLMGRVPMGAGAGAGLTPRTLGSAPSSAETAQLSAINLPDHQHGINMTTSSNGAHTHTSTVRYATSAGGSTPTLSTYFANQYGSGDWVTIASAGAHTHTVSGNSDPDSQSGNSMQASPFSIIPPAQVFNFIIRSVR